MSDEYIPDDYLDEGEHLSEREQDARIESELPPFKYVPATGRLTENKRIAMDNDTAVEMQNKRSRVAAQRRFHLDTFYRSFLDDDDRDLDSQWDRIREGRSAT